MAAEDFSFYAGVHTSLPILLYNLREKSFSSCQFASCSMWNAFKQHQIHVLQQFAARACRYLAAYPAVLTNMSAMFVADSLYNPFHC